MDASQIMPELLRLTSLEHHTEEEILAHFEERGHHLIDYQGRKLFLFAQGRDFADRHHIISIHANDNPPIPEHIYSYVLLTYCYRGSLPLVIDGEERTLQQGDCAVLDRHVPHSVKATGHEDLAINMVLADDFFEGRLLDGISDLASPFATALATIGMAHTDWRVYHTQGEEPVQSCMERILCEWLEPDMTSPYLIDFLLEALLLHLLRRHEPKGELDDVAFERADLIGRVHQYITEHYQEGNLTRMAKDLGYERTYLSKSVKNATGKTFKQLVNAERMRHAALMLRGTTDPVYEVAQGVGIANLTSFYQRFREYAGCTPQEYRNLS